VLCGLGEDLNQVAVKDSIFNVVGWVEVTKPNWKQQVNVGFRCRSTQPTTIERNLVLQQVILEREGSKSDRIFSESKMWSHLHRIQNL
jgi:hypothetical protein